MGLRHVCVVVGAVCVAGAIALFCGTVLPEEAEASAATKTCGGGSIVLTTKEKRVLTLHNRARANRNLKTLCVDPRLTRAARSHSREMIRKDYFSHSSHNGESAGRRLKRFGYNWRVYGENIAGGSGTYANPDRIFRSWMNSPGHRSNILDGRFRHVGVGAYTGAYKGYSGYTMYTVDFGARR